MPDRELLAETLPANVPLYTHFDAARYLHLPVWLVLSTTQDQHYLPFDYFERFVREVNHPVRFQDDLGPGWRNGSPDRISFRSLAALFVITSLFRSCMDDPMYLWKPPRRGFRHPNHIHDITRTMFDHPRVFTDPEWVLDRLGRVLESGRMSDPATLLKRIRLYQSRVELKDGLPYRLFPCTRADDPEAARLIVIDPEVRFGRPTLRGVPTDVLVERWRAGDSVTDLAEDYDLKSVEIEEALRYESAPRHIPFIPPSFDW